MSFGSLHHVEIYVSDLSKARQFWDWFFDYLGYTQFQIWSEGISYKKGITYIVLVQTEQHYLKNAYHRKNVGLNHLAFWGKSPSQLDEFRKILEQRDITLLYNGKYPYAGGEGYYALYFEDPVDRMKIEMVAPNIEFD